VHFHSKLMSTHDGRDKIAHFPRYYTFHVKTCQCTPVGLKGGTHKYWRHRYNERFEYSLRVRTFVKKISFACCKFLLGNGACL
jgi:hypothetical protein